jgi:hypothetical protein
MGKYDIDHAAELWRNVYASGFDWVCPDEVIRIAAMCGLGVLSVQARNHATELIRVDFKCGRTYDRSRYDALARSAPDFALRWARHLLDAAKAFPTMTSFPISEPANHRVGGSGCYGSARKGQWSDECYRAAWGNVIPFGLALAEKPCPRCKQAMHYWCWGKNGDPAKRWAIDHVSSHAGGGCVCHFNLQALHPHCNSSKGGG